jgi:hypothetical protein
MIYQLCSNNGIIEKYCLTHTNNNIYIEDIINDNIKIYVKKIIKPESNKGKMILYYLGYDIDESTKIILKCRFIYKSTNCNFFNNIFKKNYTALLIITSNSTHSPIILYKYKIYKNNTYKFANILIEEYI